jgi:predicted HAD superfamily phosphohydrolase
MHSALNLERPIVAYITVGFLNVANIKNNVGIIWVSLDETTTLEEFHDIFNKSKYHAPATNFVLVNKLDKLFNRNMGDDVRKNVDVVLTSGYLNSNSDIKFLCSYEHISLYPLYVTCMSCVSDGKLFVNETITSNTGSLKIQQDYTELKASYFHIPS